nr:O-antigen ligase family protein [Nocardioides ginsengisegetis]
MSDRGRSPLRRWYPVVALGVAIPLSISRSALISAFVGLAVLGVAWTPAVRRSAFAWVAALNAVVLVVEPGVFRSLLSLFTDIGGDTSAQSRTSSYAMAWDYIQMSPLVGRGFATFLPSYRILDNQLLGLLIEVGAVGLAAFLALLCVAVACGVLARRRTTDPVLAQLGQALAASVCAALCSLALFDGLAFPMSGGMLFLVLGITGALWQVVRTGEPRA